VISATLIVLAPCRVSDDIGPPKAAPSRAPGAFDYSANAGV
jgi:hypothetical protein